MNDQIEVSIQEALARAKKHAPVGESLEECADCGEPIPKARREALPGVRLCLECAREHDRDRKPAGGINRRASKDSQLK